MKHYSKIYYVLLSFIITITAFVFTAYGQNDTGNSKCLYWKASVSEQMAEGRVYESRTSTGWWLWLRTEDSQYFTYGTDIQLKGTPSSVVILHEFVGDPGKYYLGKCPQEN